MARIGIVGNGNMFYNYVKVGRQYGELSGFAVRDAPALIPTLTEKGIENILYPDYQAAKIKIDLTNEKLQQKGLPQLHGYRGHKRLIDEGKPSVVVIATNNNSHLEIATDCLKADINIYCEKPFVEPYQIKKARKLAHGIYHARNRGVVFGINLQLAGIEDQLKDKKIYNSHTYTDIKNSSTYTKAEWASCIRNEEGIKKVLGENADPQLLKETVDSVYTIDELNAVNTIIDLGPHLFRFFPHSLFLKHREKDIHVLDYITRYTKENIKNGKEHLKKEIEEEIKHDKKKVIVRFPEGEFTLIRCDKKEDANKIRRWSYETEDMGTHSFEYTWIDNKCTIIHRYDNKRQDYIIKDPFAYSFERFLEGKPLVGIKGAMDNMYNLAAVVNRHIPYNATKKRFWALKFLGIKNYEIILNNYIWPALNQRFKDDAFREIFCRAPLEKIVEKIPIKKNYKLLGLIKIAANEPRNAVQEAEIKNIISSYFGDMILNAA